MATSSSSLAEAVALLASKTQQVLDASLVIAGKAVTQDKLDAVAGLAGQAIQAVGEAAKKFDLAASGGAATIGTTEGTVQQALSNRLKPADLSSAAGAGKIGASAPVVVPYLQTVSDIVNGSPVSLFRFVQTDKISEIRSLSTAYNASPAFQLAVNSGAKRLVADYGVFNLDTTVTLVGGVEYDLQQARLVPGAGCTAYMLKAIGQSGFKIKGGDYSFKPGTTPQIVIPTGTYSVATMIYIENCSDFEVTKTRGSRTWTHINVYNSREFLVADNQAFNCNAGIAAVAASTVSGTPVCKQGTIIGNRIIQCGDDGIFVGPQQAASAVRNISVIGNIITKETNSVNLLDGSVVAAVPIRIGNNIANPGTTEFITVLDNNISDAVDTGILCAAVSRSIVSRNVVRNYAKRPAAAFRMGLGSALFFRDSIFSENIATGNVVDARAMDMDGAIDSTFRDNKLTCSVGGEGGVRADNSTGNWLIGNKIVNTKAYAISMESTSSANVIERNNLSTYVSLPVRDLYTGGAVNQYKDNTGFVTKSRGTATQASGATSALVSHGLGPLVTPFTPSTSRVRVSLQPRSAIGAAKAGVVTNIADDTFTIQTDVAPGSAVTWDWLAELV